MGIKNLINQAGEMVADSITNLSSLSREQVEIINQKRQEYFLEIPDNDSDKAKSEIEKRLGAIGIEIYNEYLKHIRDYYVPVEKEAEYDTVFNPSYNIRYINITKWVIDKDENSLEKLVNVYEVLSNENCNIALVFHRSMVDTSVYLAVTNTQNASDNVDVENYRKRLVEAIRGNFPGAEWKGEKGVGILPCMRENRPYSIAIASNIPGEKSEKFISQTIEKLLDGIIPKNPEKEYTIVLLATPVKDVDDRKLHLADMYSAIYPYASWQSNFSYSESNGENSSATLGVNLGIPLISLSQSESPLQLKNGFGASFARSSNVSLTVGKNEGITKSFTNYTIKHTLEILEAQMKRLDESSALGMWDFAAYFISEDQNVANNVAHSYLALTQGEKSYMSQTTINLWRGDTPNSDDAKEIFAYLRELRHPVFGLNPEIAAKHDDFIAYPTIINATTSLTGKELAYSLNFPKKSIAGFPVIECAEFGRNIVTYDGNRYGEELNVGKIFHMNHEEQTSVSLGKNSLASHVFITGSTGSGKSNTVYQILGEAVKKNVKFMVIEPAKGEYKQVFGNTENVAVYGINPLLTPMLQLNPFSFPEGVHIYEHMDRLVEIFNVCWHMYAAMPVVLKNAIEKAYEDCGWDLLKSVNRFNEQLYPSFKDVARNIKNIIESSEYDAENKGAYKGALLTRLESLTNGINGTVFVTDELSSKELFDENVVVDLSRVGSAETKSLIMGILVLKLQEYRMASSFDMNSELRHITVLEEAHNLLRRTSSTVTSESGNLRGKSVEMISNAIAEMRTYGEGFIIVDQAPGLLDMSAIRNTNTKIIMRLPDQEDRELVGRSANLNDDQIQELAKLPCGVGAIYQNEWIQPVLCKIQRYPYENRNYVYQPDEDVFERMNVENLSESLLDFIMNHELFNYGEKVEIKKFRSKVLLSKLDTVVKIDLLNYLESAPEENIKKLRVLLYDLLHADIAIASAEKATELSLWVHTVVENLNPSIKQYSVRQINLALGLLLYEQSQRNSKYNDIYCRYTEVYKKEGRVF